MTPAEYQTWLNDHGASLKVDGHVGPASRAAMLALFANPSAVAVTPEQVQSFAHAIGCTEKQLRAVAKVESGGAAYDTKGRPKILFERHYFHRLTMGKWSVSAFSNSTGGGYSEDSWQKLADACERDPWAAFQSISIGKFQIMGAHWNALGYASPLQMAWSMRQSEAGHYEALVRFITVNKLGGAVRMLSANSTDNVAFAARYNGPGYAKFNYHTKLAGAMA